MPYRNLRELSWILLLPLSFLWAVGTFLRRRWYPKVSCYRPRHATWCIGNLHSGGSGKTPLVLAIAERFAAHHPVILSRGYGGSLSSLGARVDPTRGAEGPALYGDEPWLLARRLSCPVHIGRSRAKVAREIDRATGPALLLLDDGFQHLALVRDTDIVIISTSNRLADAFCLPWGSLREPLCALRSASAVVLNATGSDEALEEWMHWLGARHPTLPRFVVRSKSQGLYEADTLVTLGEADRGAAFCGIADPERFGRSLKTMLNPLWIRHFPDHHAYCDEDIAALIESAPGATFFVTTEKDWHKAWPSFERRGARLLSLRIQYEIPEEFWYFLASRLETK